MNFLKRVPRHWRLTLAALITVIAAGVGVYFWLLADLPDVANLQAELRTPSIRITDRRGRLLFEVLSDSEGRNTVLPIDAIPQACREATIATEDASFYTNPGVDAWSIARAAWNNLRGGEIESGASTITQQVARNLLLNPQERAERTLARKLREAILAYQLSQRYSKDEILALYLNQTYYGNLAYGIDAAARGYFSKSAADLDLAECALLAGLPQSPSAYDPLSNPEAALARQKIVLGLMLGQGFITAEDAALAEKETLAFAAERYTIEAPHFVQTVYAELETALPPEVLRAGGLVVTTTLDLDWQRAAEQIAKRQLKLLNEPRPGDPPHNAHNAALVALDPHTGQVLAMLGSPDYTDGAISGGVNMALSPRQPGSALKPFTYAAAFDPDQREPWTAATMILDVRTAFVTRQRLSYVPVNYDRAEHGPVLARTALASSLNIPAVITLDHIRMGRLFELLGRLGISTLNTPSDYDLSLTLGGGEVRLLELTAAYAAFANGGKVAPPVMILEARNAAGEVVYRPPAQPDQQAVDPRVAWLISDILSDNLARAPTFTTHSILQIGRPAAVKTGTTTDYRDNWTVGYTPNLAVGVWVGNANNEGMVGISGITGAGPIWHNFMREALKGQPELRFERPDGMIAVEVCALSGMLPSPECPATTREWFVAGTQPTEPDTLYQRVTLDAATGLPATDATPPERRIDRVFVVLPPQARDWALANHLPMLPPEFAYQAAGTGGAAHESPLRIVSPDAQTVYRITPTLPLESQQIRITALAGQDFEQVTITLDGAALATLTKPRYEAWWQLVPGQHEVYAEGITSAGEVIRSETVKFTVKPPG